MTKQYSGWIYSQTPIWITCDPRISARAYRLLVYLLWRQGHDDVCWPSLGRMARDLDASRETVRRRLRELERAGYLLTRRRPGRSSTYAIVRDPDGASETYTPVPDGTNRVPPTVPRAGRLGPEGGGPSKARGTPRRSGGAPPSTRRGTHRRPEGHDDRKGREEEDGEKEDELAACWLSILEELKLQMTRTTFDLWLAHSAARWDGDGLIVELASPRAVEAVSHRLGGTVARTARRIVGREDLSVAYEARGP